MLGPGFGESAVVHLGSGHWIVIDSCYDRESNCSAPLAYLRERGANLERVSHIIATHWHDDHVRGISELYAACPNAKFCTSSALTNAEFVHVLHAHAGVPASAITSGGDEMLKVMEIVRDRGHAIVRAVPNRQLINLQAGELAHGLPVSVWTLSPHDEQFDRFLASLSRLLPGVGTTKRRIPSVSQNDCSVVVVVNIGDTSVLLGADLEEEGKSGYGWSAIVQMTPRNINRVSLFKIPHHGSSNGHCDEVWSDLLQPKPTCILAPYNKGRKLPQPTDVRRILSKAGDSYSTQKVKSSPLPRRDTTVEKTIREAGVKLRALPGRPGCVRARLINPTKWEVLLGYGACHLSDVHA